MQSSFTDAVPSREKRDFSEQEAVITVLLQYAEGLKNMSSMIGRQFDVIYMFHQAAKRDDLVVHPHGDKSREARGVFATRCNKRPNGLGLCSVTLLAVEDGKAAIRVRGLDAVDGTPVIDIKPHSCCAYQGSS